MEKIQEFLSKKKEKQSKQSPKYGMRKLSIGFVSCFLGCMIFMAPGQIHAQVETNKDQAPLVAIEEPATQGPEAPKVEAIVEEKAQDNLASEEAEEAQEEPKAEAMDASVAKDSEEATAKEENATEEISAEKIADEEELLLSEEIEPEALKAGETEEDAITNVEITIGGAKNGEKTEIVNPTALPNRIEEGTTDINLEAQVDFDIPEGTKQGKTFDFVVSDNVNLHGVLESEKEGESVVFDGEKIATAEKLTDGRNGYRYTFNEKVDGLKDIRVRIIYPLFIDPDKVPMGTKEYVIGEDGKYVLDDEGNPVLKADNKETVSVTVGGKTVSKDYTVEYENEVFDIKDNMPTLSGTADIDQVTDNNYNHTIYVNPTADQLLNGSHVTVQNEKGYNTVTFDEKVKSTVKVYKVKDPNKLPLSFGNHFDDGNYEDVTSSAEVKLEKDDNNADLNKLVVNVKQGNTNESMPFDDEDFDSSSYVITYTGKRTPNKAFKTNTIFTADWRKADGNVKNLSHLDDQSWEWTNEIVIDDADAIAIANKTYSLGDKVWIDADEDGSQGDSEEGLEGVKVILKGINMSDRETTTDKNGNYKFEGLRNGEYTIEFTIPTGYKQTEVKVKGEDGKTDDVTNSDASAAEGAKVAIATGEIDGKNNMNVDFGVIKSNDPTPEEKTYTLGDRVWIDDNKDGLQTEGEKGLKGVTVKLTGKDLTEEKTTITDENGNYRFTDLKNGNYTVKFELSEEDKAKYEATKINQGDDDKNDSDGATVNVTIKDANDNTVDFGLVKKESPVTKEDPKETPKEEPKEDPKENPRTPDPKPNTNPGPKEPSQPIGGDPQDSNPVQEESKDPVSKEESPVQKPVEEVKEVEKSKVKEGAYQDQNQAPKQGPSDDSRAPQTFDPGVASYVSLAGLASGLMAYLESKKRKNN